MDFGQDTVWAHYSLWEARPLLILFLLNLITLARACIYLFLVRKNKKIRAHELHRNRNVLLFISIFVSTLLISSVYFRYFTVVRPHVISYLRQHPDGIYRHNLDLLTSPIGLGFTLFFSWFVPVLSMLIWRRVKAAAQQVAGADNNRGSSGIPLANGQESSLKGKSLSAIILCVEARGASGPPSSPRLLPLSSGVRPCQ